MDPLETAEAFINLGGIANAEQILADYVRRDRSSDRAWMLLSRCYTDVEKKKTCLEFALRANPRNHQARAEYEDLTRPAPVNPLSFENLVDPQTVERPQEAEVEKQPVKKLPRFSPGKTLQKAAHNDWVFKIMIAVTVVVVLAVAGVLFMKYMTTTVYTPEFTQNLGAFIAEGKVMNSLLTNGVKTEDYAAYRSEMNKVNSAYALIDGRWPANIPEEMKSGKVQIDLAVERWNFSLRSWDYMRTNNLAWGASCHDPGFFDPVEVARMTSMQDELDKIPSLTCGDLVSVSANQGSAAFSRGMDTVLSELKKKQ